MSKRGLKYIGMPDGFNIQVEPVMTETQHLASGTGKYFSYKNYLKTCKDAMKVFKEKDMLEQSTGLKPKTMTPEEFHNFLEYAKEHVKIKFGKKRGKKHE